jgi:hypothetical protein
MPEFLVRALDEFFKVSRENAAGRRRRHDIPGKRDRFRYLKAVLA